MLTKHIHSIQWGLQHQPTIVAQHFIICLRERGWLVSRTGGYCVKKLLNLKVKVQQSICHKI